MALHIISANERLAARQKVNIALFGPSGVGKTFQASTLDPEKTLFLDLEAGTLAIQAWRGAPDETSERGYDSAEPHIRAISDRHGNIMVLMTHNTDISDAWEREGEDPRYFYLFSPKGYAVGINAIMYAMTH